MNSLPSFYDKFYSEHQHPFGVGVDEFVQKLLGYCSSGSLLDCGSGDGRNAVYFAQHGFDVDAVDISQVACDQLRTAVNDKKLVVRVFVGDATAMRLDKTYDVILCVYMLHHISRESAAELIKNMKAHTADQGLNVIMAHTVNGDFFRQNIEGNNFFDDNNSVHEFYSDWEVLEYQKMNQVAAQKKLDGAGMENEVVCLIARND